MQNGITLSVTYEDTKAIIIIGGDVTSVTGGELRKAYDKSSDKGAMKFDFQFAPDCYINSGGLLFLLDIAKSSKKKKQDICVLGLSDHFMKIFKMVGLTQFFDIIQAKHGKQ